MLELGILKTFDSGTWTAAVQLASSPTTYFDIAVARNIASGDMVVGRHVIVALPGQQDPKNAVVIGVFTP